MTRLVRVYKSSRKLDAYLFVDYTEQLERVPESLLKQMGKVTEVLSLKLTEERTLANAEASAVLEQIESAGYYLQLPPLESGLFEEIS